MKRYWLSILILVAGLVFAALINGIPLYMFLDLPGFIIAVATPFLFVTILFGFKNTRRAFSTFRKNEKEHDALHAALAFFKVYSKATSVSAVIAVIIGGIGLMANLDDKTLIGPCVALALISVFYSGVVQLAIIMPHTVFIHNQLGNSKIRGVLFSTLGSLFGVIAAVLLMLNFIIT